MVTYPLNNIDYTAEDAELYLCTRESGVYDGENDFAISVSGLDNDVTIGTGIAWIKNSKFSGKVVALKEPKTFSLSLSDTVYDRIDSVVVRFDAGENKTDVVIKEGIASSNPIAPTVTRSGAVFELHIYQIRRKAGSVAVSASDVVDVRKDPAYCGIMIDPVSSVDKTLSLPGYAAEASSVGNAIKNAIATVTPKSRTINGKNLYEDVVLNASDVSAAPSGYGLGEYAASASDLNAETSGLYQWDAAAQNRPFDYGTAVIVRRDEGSGSEICVGVSGTYKGVVVVRSKNSEGWIEEFLNPPMIANKEYRTTERYMGRSVYVKYIDVGSLSSNGQKSVNVLDSSAINGRSYEVVSFNGVATDGTYPCQFPIHGSSGVQAYDYLTKTSSSLKLTIQSIKDMSSYTAKYVIKYIYTS